MHLVRVLGKLEPGGAQLAVLRLTRELERTHGVRTTLLVGDATPEGIDLARRHGVHAVAFGTHRRIHPVRNLQWVRSGAFADWLGARVVDADVVHAHMVGAWWAAAQVVGDVPLVASEHNEVTWGPRRLRALRSAAARVDLFFAMGPSARAFAVAAGVRPATIRAARSSLDGLGALARPGLATPRLTFAGRFCADKGVDVLLEALALLPPGLVTAYLLGDGPLRAQVADGVARLGLVDRVVLTGWVDDPGTFIAGSAVHVVPSREEAWSQSAVLALGHGVPVVGTSVDGLVDTLSGGRGLSVAAGDAPALALAVAGVLAGRGRVDPEVGRAYAQQFTAARVADFHLAAYADVRGSRRREAVAAELST